MDQIVSIEDAAVEAGVELHVFIGWLCESGLLLVQEEDPDCDPWDHAEGCGCVLVASPHPDLVPLI